MVVKMLRAESPNVFQRYNVLCYGLLSPPTLVCYMIIVFSDKSRWRRPPLVRVSQFSLYHEEIFKSI